MTIPELFETMEYGPAPESAKEALAWVAGHGGRFGHWIGGAWTKPARTFETRNPATGKPIARISQAAPKDVDAAVSAARKAFPTWSKMSGHQRARVLYGLARLVQKNARLLATLETLDNGKPIRESRDIDIPLVARHFYYHAGLAQLEERGSDRVPHGVCGQIVPWNFPLLMLAWKVAPALAAGNTVVLKPAEYTSLTALLFAEISREAGVPPGVLNIVTGDGRPGEALVAHPGVDKIAFTGSTEVGRKIRIATAGSGKALTLELGGKSPYIVFDDADIDSAIEGLVDAIWFNQGQVCCAGSRLLVQEGIAERFHEKLHARMRKLRIGDPFDKTMDMGAIIDEIQLRSISELVSSSEGRVFQPDANLPENGLFYPPTLITGLSPSDPLMREEIFGPVLVSTTFRTPEEAVLVANDTRYGLAATLWTENVNLALDVAPKLAAGVVWVNSTNLFDAAAAFGGIRESGFGREGGREGFRTYTTFPDARKPIRRRLPIQSSPSARISGIDRTAKLYIGGKQARPDGGYSRAIWARGGKLLGHAAIANRKDLRNAVEAARNARSWSKASGHARAQVLYFVAENLEARSAEFASKLQDLTGTSAKAAKAEVSMSISRLFTWAAWADKHDGQVKQVPLRGLALALHEPVGVIGIVAPDAAPLLGLISAIAPAISMGNSVVVIASEPFPLAATDFYQVLDTSDVPPGVVNILTGGHAELAPELAGHADVDACWCFSSSDLSSVVERESAGNLKRTWVNHVRSIDWSEAQDAAFLEAATEIKTIWVPYGT